MLIIGSWGEALLRYPELDKLSAVSSTATNTSSVIAANQAALVANAEAYVHGRLGSNFSVPFSSNNMTAKDLVIDTLYVQNIQSRQILKGKTLAAVVDEKIKALLLGATSMVDINGTILAAFAGDVAWSNTMNYHPVFGMGAPEVTAIDSQQLIDENTARGDPSQEAI